MNRKKDILIAIIAIIMMIIIGQSYIIHNQARFDGTRVCSIFYQSLIGGDIGMKMTD
ncbi:hypothetical protein SAMN02910398_02409 [Butyrivibrio sp. YAB3001]|nr:hypothetical protein SAMN02910398_02409 [Butyrivibrio sp. YAB3001]